jgi:pimeloyl-ACP methyl ester carboxylesterase
MLILVAASVAYATGCSQRAARMTVEPQARGCVVMIPGVVGQAKQLDSTCETLRDAGVDHRFEIISWGTSAFQPIENLTDLPANEKRADAIAAKLTDLYRAQPDQPLILMAKSGGAGLAVMAVERLPQDVMLDRVILIAAAVSNDYDLSAVQARCKDKLVNFHSQADPMVGFGTLVFGTIDRRNAISAGHSGFVNDAGQKCHDDKLEQIAWNPTWLLLGHYGGHMGYRGDGWIRQHLAPHIDPTLTNADRPIADRNNETDTDERITRRPNPSDPSPA